MECEYLAYCSGRNHSDLHSLVGEAGYPFSCYFQYIFLRSISREARLCGEHTALLDAKYKRSLGYVFYALYSCYGIYQASQNT
jgi:hypothetical protein